MASSKKPALVFVHGLCGNPKGLTDVANFFPDYEVHIPSIPPFGDSSSLPEYTANSYADFIVNYVHENHLKNPVLIGHSMGSIIVSAVAEKYPEEINEKIILLAPISHTPNKFITSLQPLMSVLPRKFAGWCSIMYTGKRKYNRKILKHALVVTYESWLNYTSIEDVVASTKFSAATSAADFNFNKDALFISGTRENLVPKKATENFAKKVNAKTKYIPRTGHLLNLETPSETATLIREFLNQ